MPRYFKKILHVTLDRLREKSRWKQLVSKYCAPLLGSNSAILCHSAAYNI
jgi:hypothetical protein